MPSGIPVATVAINGGKNAAYLALEIMAVKDPTIRQKLLDHRLSMNKDCLEKNKEIMMKYEEE